MKTKLSRILGIAGSALSLLAVSYHFLLNDLDGYLYDFSATDAIPSLIAAIGLAGGFLIRKKPVLAAVFMIVSGTFIFPFFALALNTMPDDWISFIPTVLLIVAGVLTLVGRYPTASIRKLRNK